MSGSQTLSVSIEKNSPAPNGSVLTYALIGASLAAVTLLAFAGFYDIDLLSHPAPVAGVTALALAGGAIMHFLQAARHRAAHIEACVAS